MMKKEFRLKLIERRKNIQNITEKEEQIFNNFLKLDLKFDKVLIYMNTGTEVSTKRFLNYFLEKNIEVYAPKCVSETEMKFFKIKKFEDFQIGKFKILEPIGTEEIKVFDNAICLVPALGFTLEGDRIGYGKGYYDRFLEKNNMMSIGLCYKEQVCEFIPTQATDKRINFVLTDNFSKDEK